jgi:hypothetical protein
MHALDVAGIQVSVAVSSKLQQGHEAGDLATLFASKSSPEALSRFIVESSHPSENRTFVFLRRLMYSCLGLMEMQTSRRGG